MRALAMIVAIGCAPAWAWGGDEVARDGDVLVDELRDASCRAEHARVEVARACRRHVRPRGDRLVLATPVRFAYGKGQLRPESFPVLREVAQVLIDQPALQIEVQGHDAYACDYCAVPLSKRRAEAVVAFLIAQGVDANRLQARGYGDSVPLIRPRTDAERIRNSRIELRILPPPAPPAVTPPAVTPPAVTPPAAAPPAAAPPAAAP